jgi:hypothetical protein
MPLKRKLIDLCIEIYAHDDIGVPSEAAGVAEAILAILGLTWKNISEDAQKRAEQLRKDYGLND